MQRYRRIFICFILPHDGRIPKKDKTNAYITYVHMINLEALNLVLNFTKDIARLL